MRKLFGTDGIRGVAGEHPVTPEVCQRLAGALAVLFHDSTMENLTTAAVRPSVIIGQDSRISGDMLERALTAHFASCGVDVRLLGIVPTAAASILTKKLGANAGIMISASHNPFRDNGLKVFDGEGSKLTDDAEAKLEGIMMDDALLPPSGGEACGLVRQEDDGLAIYRNLLMTSSVFDKSEAAAVKIVLDSANGALSSTAAGVFREFNFDLVSIHDSPNGSNINDGCGATNPDVLAAAVIEHQADVGIAFDGDGDRLLLADENGDPVDGDTLLAILIRDGNFPRRPVVSTIMANLALEQYLTAGGRELIRTAVGDRHVFEEMRRLDAALGGEPSGHIIIASHAHTGDGLFVALKLMECFVRSQKKFSEFRNVFRPYPSLSENILVMNKSVIHLPEVEAALEQAKATLQDNGRVILRPSGTEPVVRIYAEGEDQRRLREAVDLLRNVIGAVR
ncbi:MAG: phosphoglucosamine mutase [Holosporaceae bacterium]|jgi:phosphoglucosamine mutase|nr:phosphoglucosamine mutase [Holosporaceae bacterium]